MVTQGALTVAFVFIAISDEIRSCPDMLLIRHLVLSFTSWVTAQNNKKRPKSHSDPRMLIPQSNILKVLQVVMQTNCKYVGKQECDVCMQEMRILVYNT